MPIDHIGIRVKQDDHKKTVEFYIATLKPLNYKKVMAIGPNEESVGLGAGRGSDFWIVTSDTHAPPSHFAFTAEGKFKGRRETFYGISRHNS